MTIASNYTLKPSQVSEALDVLVGIKQPIMIWGPPGVGKSAIVKQVADESDLELRDVRAILLDPVDLRGLPHINGDGRAHWAVPEFLPREGKGILFLDELTAAPQLTQAACYQLILDRKLGEYECQRRSKISPPGRSKTSPLDVMRYAVLGCCPGSPKEGPALLRVALALRETKQRGRFLWTHRGNHCTGG